MKALSLWMVFVLAVWCLVAAGCDRGDRAVSGGQAAGTVTVFAAASTTEVMTELARRYEAATGVKIKCSFASSSTLAKQIEAGAQADVYVSANPTWMDYLIDRHMIQGQTRVALVGNELVLIAPRGRRFTVQMKQDFAIADAFAGRLAVGDPDHVPAGIYARQALENLGWWSALEDRLVPAMDVRGALLFVELAEADAGIVYETDAVISDKVEVIAAFPQATYDAVRYPAALCHGASDQAEAFLEYLQSSKAAEVFTKAGFRTLNGD